MFARTKRLTLRPGWAEDAPALTRAIAHEAVVMKLAQAPWPYALADAEWYLGSRETAPVTEIACLILAHEGADQPRLVGGIGIHPSDDGPELGYWLTPDAWGRGYATEAGHAVIDMARHALGLTRLVSGHFVDNPASGHVLAKLGFIPTGRIEQRPCRARRTRVPCATYALDLAEEDRPPARMAA